jgi:hypothetical protein
MTGWERREPATRMTKANSGFALHDKRDPHVRAARTNDPLSKGATMFDKNQLREIDAAALASCKGTPVYEAGRQESLAKKKAREEASGMSAEDINYARGMKDVFSNIAREVAPLFVPPAVLNDPVRAMHIMALSSDLFAIDTGAIANVIVEHVQAARAAAQVAHEAKPGANDPEAQVTKPKRRKGAVTAA